MDVKTEQINSTPDEASPGGNRYADRLVDCAKGCVSFLLCQILYGCRFELSTA